MCQILLFSILSILTIFVEDFTEKGKCYLNKFSRNIIKYNAV